MLDSRDDAMILVPCAWFVFDGDSFMRRRAACVKHDALRQSDSSRCVTSHDLKGNSMSYETAEKMEQSLSHSGSRL
jgi:hypothetical protein